MSRPPRVDPRAYLKLLPTSHGLFLLIWSLFMSRLILSVFLPSRTVILILILSKTKDLAQEYFPFSSPPQITAWERRFLRLFLWLKRLERALASIVLLKIVSSLHQNPFPTSCNPLSTHPFDPPSLPACSCGENGSKDEAPSKKKISPWAGRKCLQKKASCSVLHCSHSGFSVYSRSLSDSP